MKYHTVHLPVKIHILRYLQHHFPTPYTLCDSDTIGPFLTQILRRPEDTMVSQTAISKLSHSWELRVPEYISHDRGAYYFGSRNVMTFNTFIDSLMKERLYDRVQLLYARNEEQKEVILDFMREYSVTESEFSFDAWKKAVQRIGYRDQKKMVKPSKNMSLVKCA